MKDPDALLADGRYYADRSRFISGPGNFSIEPASLKYLISNAKITYACPEHSKELFLNDLKKIGYNKFFLIKTHVRTKTEKQSYSAYLSVPWSPSLKFPENVVVKDRFDKGNRIFRVDNNAFVGFLLSKGLKLQ